MNFGDIEQTLVENFAEVKLVIGCSIPDSSSFR